MIGGGDLIKSGSVANFFQINETVFLGGFIKVESTFVQVCLVFVTSKFRLANALNVVIIAVFFII